MNTLKWIGIGIASLIVLVFLLYTEEDLRGKWAWEQCKHQLEAQGVVLDWNKYIPPSVPDDQNFYTFSTNFLVFKQIGANEVEALKKITWLKGLSAQKGFPIFDTYKSGPIVVAKIIILPHTSGLASGSKTLVASFHDPGAREQVQSLIRATIGQTILGAAGFEFSQFQLTSLQPAQIFMQADAPPSVTDLADFIPSDTIGQNGRLRVVATANPIIFQVQLTTLRITSAADYLEWSDQFVPAFNDIREALKRPYAILPGDYSLPYQIPIPNFVMMRALAQTLGQRAQCYLLLGEPDKALHELTLVHDVCRILEKPPTGQPETLVEAMINVAIHGLYVQVIAEGMQRHEWQEPQLEALQEQLRQINLAPHVFEAFREGPARMCRNAEIIPPQRWLSLENGEKGSWLSRALLWLMPRGWVYQNAAVVVEFEVKTLAIFDASTGAISPRKAETATRETQKALGHHSPFYLLADIAVPNYSKVCQTTAYNQTLVNEAQIACALERCRLVHGEYPDSLDALMPAYMETIPQDIIDGQPLHYRRTDDGKFLLYSVGWNERDDGGQELHNQYGNHTDYAQGDWVWPATVK